MSMLMVIGIFNRQVMGRMTLTSVKISELAPMPSVSSTVAGNPASCAIDGMHNPDPATELSLPYLNTCGLGRQKARESDTGFV